MRCVIPTATATRKKRTDSSDLYLEKKTQLPTRSLLSRGNQIQFVSSANVSSRPTTKKGTCQPPQFANTATIGTVMAETTPLRANKAVTAWARLAGDMIADTTAHRGGRQCSPRQTRQHPECQQHFDIGRKS